MSRATMGSAQIREIYDRLAPSYDRRRAPLEWLLFRRYRSKLLSWAGGRVLEVGIGTGRSLPHYPSDCEITGIDLSPRMLELARQRAARLGLEVELVPMNAQELAFPDGRFDMVVSNLALCTVVDPIRALGEMSRVAKPDGRLLLLEHGRSLHRWFSWIQDRRAPAAIRRTGCHPNRNMVALVQAADLVVLKAERLLGGVIHLIHARPPRATKVFK